MKGRGKSVLEVVLVGGGQIRDEERKDTKKGALGLETWFLVAKMHFS